MALQQCRFRYLHQSKIVFQASSARRIGTFRGSSLNSDGRSFSLQHGSPDCKTLPAIGMGTFTGTRFNQKAAKTGPGGVMEENIKLWVRCGGRMIDAAQNYLNEAEIGDAIATVISEKVVTREELFVSSKLNNPYHKAEHVRPALEKTLKDLKLDYVDNYLIHWPTAFVFVPIEGMADPRYGDSGRGFVEEYEPDQCSKVTGTNFADAHWDSNSAMPPHLATGVTIHETWRAMVECQKAGLAKNIGVCNMNVQLLHELCVGNPQHIPSVLQCESHPYLQQWDLIIYCQRMGIQFQAYSPLGYGEFKGDQEIFPLRDPLLEKIAKKHGVSTAQVCLRWTNQRGVATMPFTLKENEMRENLDIWNFTLDAEDMEAIKTLDRGHHYLRPATWYGLPYWS